MQGTVCDALKRQNKGFTAAVTRNVRINLNNDKVKREADLVKHETDLVKRET